MCTASVGSAGVSSFKRLVPGVIGLPSVTIRGKDSRWVSNVYYSAWIDYTWTVTYA